MSTFAILGAGDLGAQLAHLVKVCGAGEVAAYFDDTRAGRRAADGVRVAGGLDGGRLEAVAARFHDGAFDALLIGIGYRHRRFRSELRRRCQEIGMPLASLRAPAAWVDPTAEVGPGTIVSAGCTVDQNVVLGANVFLNPGCVICHESTVGNDTIVGPGVNLSGFVKVGARCFVGTGTSFADSLVMGDDAQTGAGAVVVREIPAGELHVGVPAKRAG